MFSNISKNNSNFKNKKSVNDKINDWLSIDDINEMISIYCKNKNIWEDSRFIEKNTSKIIIDLAIKNKIEMINYLFEKNLVYEQNISKIMNDLSDLNLLDDLMNKVSIFSDKKGDLNDKKTECDIKLIILQIKVWAKSNLDVLSLEQEYNRKINIWEKEKFCKINMYNVLRELTRNWRHDMLEYMFVNNDKFQNFNNFIKKSIKKNLFPYEIKSSTKTNLKDNNKIELEASPFHTTIWPDKNNKVINQKIIDENYEDLKKTINSLVKIGFNPFSINDSNNKVIKHETFLGALILNCNPLPKQSRSKLYKYFTEEWDWSLQYLDINKIFDYICIHFNDKSDSQEILYKNMLLFLLIKKPYETLKIIIKIILVQSMISIQQPLDVNIYRYFNIILKDPITSSDFNDYFGNINLIEIRNKLALILIENYEIWIEEIFIEKSSTFKEEDGQSLIDFKGCYYDTIFGIFGMLYTENLQKEKINKVLYNNIEQENKGIFMFITYSDIKYNDDVEINNILETYKNKFSSHKNSRIKFMVELAWKKFKEIRCFSPTNLLNDSSNNSSNDSSNNSSNQLTVFSSNMFTKQSSSPIMFKTLHDEFSKNIFLNLQNSLPHKVDEQLIISTPINYNHSSNIFKAFDEKSLRLKDVDDKILDYRLIETENDTSNDNVIYTESCSDDEDNYILPKSDKNIIMNMNNLLSNLQRMLKKDLELSDLEDLNYFIADKKINIFSDEYVYSLIYSLKDQFDFERIKLLKKIINLLDNENKDLINLIKKQFKLYPSLLDDLKEDMPKIDEYIIYLLQ